MSTMAVNRENRTLSPLPAEVKKLQQMNENLFAQLSQCDVFTGKQQSQEYKGQTALAFSPKISGGMRDSYPEEQQKPRHMHESNPSPSTTNPDPTSSPDRHVSPETFANPLDYSLGSKTKDSSGTISSHVSPVLRSASNCTSFVGSLSSSSSPTSPQIEQNCWKRKTGNTSLPEHIPKPSEVKTTHDQERTLPDLPAGNPDKPKSKTKMDTTRVDKLVTSADRRTGDQTKSSLKRHLTGQMTTHGNVRNSASTAAYKYLTWREKDRRRRFREEWKHLWLVVPHGRYEVMCLVCHKVMTQRKLDTIKRHTVRRHVELLGMPETDRQNLFEQLVRQHNILGAGETGHASFPSSTRSARKASENLEKTSISESIAETGRARTTMLNYGATANASTPAWLSGSSPSSKGAAQVQRNATTTRQPRGQLTRTFMKPTSPYKAAGSQDNQGAYAKPSAFHDPLAGPTDQRVTSDTFNNSYKIPSTSTNLDMIHKAFQMGSCHRTDAFAPGMANPSAKSHSSEHPFSAGSLFPSPPWPLLKPDVAMRPGSPNAVAVTSTFTQILEHLATSANSFRNPKQDATAKILESDLTKASTGLNNSLEENSPTKMQHSRSSVEQKQYRNTLNSKSPQSLSSMPKYPRHKLGQSVGHDPFPATSSLFPWKQSTTDQSVINEGQPVNKSATACAMAAAQSLLRLPPPAWPHQIAPSFLNPACRNFGQLMNPAVMATWAAMMASATSGQSAPSWPNSEATQSKIPQPSTSNVNTRFPFGSFGYPPTGPNAPETCPSRAAELANSVKLPMWLSTPESPNRGIASTERRDICSNGPSPLHGVRERENKMIPRSSTHATNDGWPHSSIGPESYLHRNQYEALLNLYRDNKNYMNHMPPSPKTLLSPRGLQESGGSATGQSFKLSEKSLHPGELSQKDECLLCNFKRTDSNGHHASPSEPLYHTCRLANSRIKPAAKDESNLPLSPRSLTESQNPILNFTSGAKSASPSAWMSSTFGTPIHTTPNPVVLRDDPMVAYYGELLRQRMRLPFDNLTQPNLPQPAGNERLDRPTASLLGSGNVSGCNGATSSPMHIQTTSHKFEISHEQDRRSLDKHQVTSQSLVSSATSSMACSPETTGTPNCDRIKPGVSNDSADPSVGPTSSSPLWSVSLNSAEPFITTCKKAILGSSLDVEDAKLSDTVGRNNLTVEILRLGPRQDLRDCLVQAVAEKNMNGAFVITCCGSLQQAHLRFANLEERVVQGPFEIVSLVGTMAYDGQPHLHIALADSNGKVIGGHLLGSAPVHTTAEVVLGLLASASFPSTEQPTFGSNQAIPDDSQSDTGPAKRPKFDQVDSNPELMNVRLVRAKDMNTGFHELMFQAYRQTQSVDRIKDLLK